MFFKRKHYQSRVIVKGSTASGKTNVVLRMLYGLYNNNHIPTVEDHYTRTYHPSRGNVTLEVIDTSETNSSLVERRPTAMTDGNILMFVYSIDDLSSFEYALHQVRKAVDNIEKQKTPILVIGAKCDLEQEREVFEDDVNGKIKVLGVQHLEVSAKKNKNMNDLVSIVVDSAVTRAQLVKKIKLSKKRLFPKSSQS